MSISKIVEADVYLPNYNVIIDINPREFLKEIPLFIIKEELKRRQELAKDAVQPDTATLGPNNFHAKQTIPVNRTIDVCADTDVTISVCENEPEIVASADIVDDLAEAFRQQDTEQFEIKLREIIPRNLWDRINMRLIM